MQVFVIRHAPAEELSDLIRSDFDRALTEQGAKRFRQFAEDIFRKGLIPDLILHSPLVRTTQTAEILREVTDLPKSAMHVESKMSPGMSIAQCVSMLSGLHVERVAIVGHNPDVSRCTSHLVGGASLDFKKGAVACIDFPGQVQSGTGRLEWYVSPKLLRGE